MNFIKKLLFSRRFYFSAILIVLLSIAANSVLAFVFFPSELHVIAGEEHSFNFNMPVAATISKNDKAVVSINRQKLENNISVNLNEPLYVQSDDECTVDMMLSFMGIPVKNVTMEVLPNIKVVPCGKTVGVRIDTDGILVLGLGEVEGEDGKVYEPCGGMLEAGDRIVKVNGKEVFKKEELISEIENSSETIHLDVERGKKSFSVDIKPVSDREEGKNKIGVWVRDSTQGIGTITYYHKDTKKFGALGHGIVDVDTKQIMEVKSGNIMESEVISVKKGKKGSPGELLGNIEDSAVIGNVYLNTEQGIYGVCGDDFAYGEKEIPIALQNEVEEGPAVILSNIEDNEIKEYDVYIESVNRYNSDNSKGMVVKIIDEELLSKTNGIVQGMSGSPIIQNGKLIGAVTHVFVQEPSKGYGIFIENMIKKTAQAG